MGVVGKRKREKRTGHVQKSPVMVEQALSLPCFQLVVLRPAPCRSISFPSDTFTATNSLT